MKTRVRKLLGACIVSFVSTGCVTINGSPMLPLFPQMPVMRITVPEDCMWPTCADYVKGEPHRHEQIKVKIL